MYEGQVEQKIVASPLCSSLRHYIDTCDTRVPVG